MNKCKVIGCSDSLYCKGYCQKHYRQSNRGSLKEPTIDSLLDTLKSYESLIHHFANTVTTPKYKELFSLLESIIKY
jgi:hypothetical protein